MRLVLAAGLGLASLGLVACGGGGGGGDSPGGGVVTPPPPPVTFTKWSDKLKAGAAVVVSGKAQEVTGVLVGSVLTHTNSAVGDGTVTETLGITGETTGLKLVAGSRTLEFTTAGGDTFAPAAYNAALTVANTKDYSRTAIFADPLKLGWNYQTLGVWRTGIPSFSGTGDAGSVSIGETTVGASIPTSATAVFRGRAVASYLNGALPSTLQATMTLTTNFASRSVRLTSSSFSEVNEGWGSLGGAGLDGTLTYAAATNSLSGTVKLTDSFDLAGTATAQFYGPAADELGGQFILQPSNGTAGRLIGAFGAAKTATTPGTSFVDWSTSRQPGATNSLSGQALTIAVTGGGSPATALGAAMTGDATYSETLDANGRLASLAVTAGGRTVSFLAAGGDTLARGRVITAMVSSHSSTALIGDPTLLGQDYQSFGVWQSGVGATSGVLGAFSTGVATAGAAIPTTGSATFRGDAALIQTSGGFSNSYSTSMTLTANFAARTADLAVSGVPLGGGQFKPGVNAALSWTAGTNALTGTATSSGGFTGTATARFFGPAAEEVGGTFSLAPGGDQTSLSRLTGAFGGRR